MAEIEDERSRRMHAMLGEPIPGKTLLADGWCYRDIPWCSTPAWNALMDTIGEDNLIRLAMSTRNDVDVRGQLLISPAGMTNLADKELLRANMQKHGLTDTPK